MSPTVVKVTGASKRFVIRKDKSLKERLVNLGRSNQHKDDFWALRDIDIDITSGSTVGLIGPNGSGKSTLLKLIGGILQPTSGTVEHRGRLAALLELGAGFHPDLTGRENVFLNASILGLSRKQTEKYFDPIVDFSGIEKFIDTQVKFYSSGMYVRLAFAVAVHVDPDVLLVDEVLAVGDEPFQRKCMDRIREFQNEGRTIILVTHALDQVADLCDRAIVLEKGVVQVDGDPLAALRHLRADFEITRQDEIEQQRINAVEALAAASHVKTTSGDPQVDGVDLLDGLPFSPEIITVGQTSSGRVLSVQLTNDAGVRIVSISPGEPVRLTISTLVDGLIDDAIVGIGLDSSLGQVMFGTNTKLLGLTLPPLSGETTFTFRLPEVWLGEGQYFVHAAIARDGGVELHRLSNGASLAVYARGDCIGFINARAELVTGPQLAHAIVALE